MRTGSISATMAASAIVQTEGGSESDYRRQIKADDYIRKKWKMERGVPGELCKRQSHTRWSSYQNPVSSRLITTH